MKHIQQHTEHPTFQKFVKTSKRDTNALALSEYNSDKSCKRNGWNKERSFKRDMWSAE